MEREKDSDEIGQQLGGISEDIKRYIEKRIKLVMLNTGGYVTRGMAILGHRSVGIVFLILGICFLFVALAIYVGKLLGSLSLGYLLVSVLLLIVGVSFISLRPRLLFNKLQARLEIGLIDAVERDEGLDASKDRAKN